MKKEEEKDEG